MADLQSLSSSDNRIQVPAVPACVLFSLDDMNSRVKKGNNSCDDRDSLLRRPPKFDVQNSLKNLAPTSVSTIFFSAKNMYAVQHGIRYRVWVETGGKYVISPQDETELSAIMRGVYLEFSRNTDFRVLDQVRELNARVLDFCVPQIVSNLEMRAHYLFDISHQPVPLELGATTSSKGDKQIEMKPFL